MVTKLIVWLIFFSTITFSQQFAIGQTPVFLLKAGVKTQPPTVVLRPKVSHTVQPEKLAIITIYNLRGEKIITVVNNVGGRLNLPNGIYIEHINIQGQIRIVPLSILDRR